MLSRIIEEVHILCSNVHDGNEDDDGNQHDDVDEGKDDENDDGEDDDDDDGVLV